MKSLQPLIVQCSGHIEGCQFSDLDSLYCRYSFFYGHDWNILGGVDTGISQTSTRNSHSDQDIIWNFPIDITFKSTNIHGWPRISLSVYGLDFMGRDVIRGYGSVMIPISPGSHELMVEMYKPIGNSPLNSVISWIFGNPPEFYDSKFVSQGEGREVTRIQRSGSVKISINIKTKGFQNAGFSITDSSH